ncbi:MAG TPA: hypothetical protein VF746_13310 [Longimicrobium sp.]|jgi:hypothetical protein
MRILLRSLEDFREACRTHQAMHGVAQGVLRRQHKRWDRAEGIARSLSLSPEEVYAGLEAARDDEALVRRASNLTMRLPIPGGVPAAVSLCLLDADDSRICEAAATWFALGGHQKQCIGLTPFVRATRGGSAKKGG